jgi:hypothetical protein
MYMYVNVYSMHIKIVGLLAAVSLEVLEWTESCYYFKYKRTRDPSCSKSQQYIKIPRITKVSSALKVVHVHMFTEHLCTICL